MGIEVFSGLDVRLGRIGRRMRCTTRLLVGRPGFTRAVSGARTTCSFSQISFVGVLSESSTVSSFPLSTCVAGVGANVFFSLGTLLLSTCVVGAGTNVFSSFATFSLSTCVAGVGANGFSFTGTSLGLLFKTDPSTAPKLLRRVSSVFSWAEGCVNPGGALWRLAFSGSSEGVSSGGGPTVWSFLPTTPSHSAPARFSSSFLRFSEIKK
mmetsp:Transcript_35077/g.56155  ORF Transcript_35077/g.56155 Transcript_35077/m.56155 type:complete len:209 (-) Transcript_35077:894-1520(-)